MAVVPVYIFYPCCGDGHPIYLQQTDQNGDIVDFGTLPHVWQYVGSLPYAGFPSEENAQLIPNRCYLVTEGSLDISYIPTVPVCPDITNFSETIYDTCEEALTDTSCNCPSTFLFTPCCEGADPIIYNVTNEAGLIVSGSTYFVAIDPLDFTTVQCYTITTIAIEDPESAPTIDISNIDIKNPLSCGDTLCTLLCEPCVCYEFTGTSGTYTVITCDLQQAVITGTIDGPQIEYSSNPGVYETVTKICLRYTLEQVPGLTVSTSGDCDVIYWNAEGSQIECPTYYKIINCDKPTEEYCVTNDLSEQYAANQALTLVGQPNKCWRIEPTEPCDQTITIIFNQTHESCTDCLEKLVTTYELINCNDESQIVYADNIELDSLVGSYISINEFPDDCWYVQVANSFVPATPITIINSFISCEDCTQQYYILEDCNIDNPELPIITGTNLQAYVGQVITLSSCPDICWQVSSTDNTLGAQPVLLSGIQSFATCEDCAQPAPTPVTPTYKYKSITPGYNTPGCSAEKFEQYSCNFSESMYRQVMVEAYGITPCCGEDDIKFEIKYELIKLKAITDPDYNCLPSTTCECSTSVSGLSQNCPTD